MRKCYLGMAVIVVLMQLLTERSYSIPAFARKYHTSCATCHNGFPKLNAFGEAFRRNGYQFPAGSDPEFIKEEPIPLGSEGNKKAFPDAIWPGSLPGSSPISLFLNSGVTYNPHVDPNDPTTKSRFYFGGLGNSIEAVAAGTFGEDLSFWGHAILNSDGTLELNRMFLIFSNLIGNSLELNARVGVIEPSLFSFSTHRAWMEGYWLTTRPLNNDVAWTIEETQKGAEFNGILNGRFGYSAGVVEGFGRVHSDKDFYGHLTYKVGGLPLDGVVGGTAAPNNSKPYIDNSVTVGAFAYSATSVVGPDSAVQSDNMKMFGGDFNAYYEQFNLFGGVGVRRDDQPFLTASGQSANTTIWFGELDVTVFPWLLPAIRLESWNSKDATIGSYTDTQFVPSVVALIRPNVKTTLRTRIAKLGLNGEKDYSFHQVSLLLAVGI